LALNSLVLFSAPASGVRPYPNNKKMHVIRKEEMVLTKVYIKRQIKEGKDKDFFELLKKLRTKAMHQPGYISGETLINTDNAQVIMVVSSWQSLEDWKSWKDNPARKEIDGLLEEQQAKPTAYESFAHSKYRVYVKKGFPRPPSSVDPTVA
jgi:heme-degrading monooxygenase HmoA